MPEGLGGVSRAVRRELGLPWDISKIHAAYMIVPAVGVSAAASVCVKGAAARSGRVARTSGIVKIRAACGRCVAGRPPSDNRNDVVGPRFGRPMLPPNVSDAPAVGRAAAAL